MTEENNANPIITFDGLEHGVWYPEDSAYKLIAALVPDEEGIRRIDHTLSAQVRGWWIHEALAKVNAVVEELAVPWEELNVKEDEITSDNLVSLSQKLARISYYVVRSNDVWGQAVARQKLCKDAIEHAVARNMARPAPEGSKMTVASRQATIISTTKPLRQAKIDLMESEALVNRMTAVRESLDSLWRTTSRILSVRLREPIE